MFYTLALIKKKFRESYIFRTPHDMGEHNFMNKCMYFPIEIFKNIILMSDRKITYRAFLGGEIKNLYLIAVFCISSLGNIYLLKFYIIWIWEVFKNFDKNWININPIAATSYKH